MHTLMQRLSVEKYKRNASSGKTGAWEEGHTLYVMYLLYLLLSNSGALHLFSK